MVHICNDNRFELIEKYRNRLIEATNIEDSPEEMKVLNDILFRFWQMGWLDKLEIDGLPTIQPSSWISVKDRLPDDGIAVLIYCPEIKCKFTAIRDLGAWHYFGGGCWNVVGWHVSDWMPLPEHEDDEEGE